MKSNTQEYAQENEDQDDLINNNNDDSKDWKGQLKTFFDKSEIFSRCLNKSLSFTPVQRGDGDMGAGHVGRYISLANPDRVSQLMCHVPAVLVSSFLALALVLFFTSSTGFLIMVTVFSAYIYFWVMQMGLSSIWGRMKMRKAVDKDHDRAVQEYLAKNPQAEQGLLHIVILPNYKEDEEMLSQTIDNLSRSGMAEKYMVVVLAMEARETEAKHKADRLIMRHKNCFKDMFATFHPANIPCEVAGKSSNSQWAFREVQKWYGNYVSQNHMEEHDASKVFLTVADADSLHHKDYFANLALQGLKMSQQERSWTIWQPPILLLRNYETVPNLVRVCSYGTFLFEISGLVSARWQDHCCFSAYSMTLALGNHPLVDGWDADVIAEDHHMYMKCMFASYWEEIFSTKKVDNVSKLQLRPVWLPVTSYLAEDPSGKWYESCYARFQQARRHSQGVAELSYLLLQYLSVWKETEGNMPLRSHYQILSLGQKYATVHIWNTVNALMFSIVAIMSFYYGMADLFTGVLYDKLVALYYLDADSNTYLMSLLVGFGWPMLACVMITANFFVVKDSCEGRYCALSLQSVNDPKRANKDSISPLSTRDSMKLLALVAYDMLFLAQPVLFMYGVIPLCMAAYSLSTHGHKFEYIVAGKPEGGSKKDLAKTSPSKFGNALPEELEVMNLEP